MFTFWAEHVSMLISREPWLVHLINLIWTKPNQTEAGGGSVVMMVPDEKTGTPKLEQLVAVAAANVAKG